MTCEYTDDACHKAEDEDRYCDLCEFKEELNA